MTLCLTLMISAATILVVTPFLRTFNEHHVAVSGEVEAFRDQLKEVEREVADDLIDADQIETARTEIKRRLLGADRANDAIVAQLSPADRNFAVIAIAGIVALGSLCTYVVKGSPELASPPPGRVAELAPVEVMIKRLVERPRQNPNDSEGWRVLGWSHSRSSISPRPPQRGTKRSCELQMVA